MSSESPSLFPHTRFESAVKIPGGDLWPSADTAGGRGAASRPPLRCIFVIYLNPRNQLARGGAGVKDWSFNFLPAPQPLAHYWQRGLWIKQR